MLNYVSPYFPYTADEIPPNAPMKMWFNFIADATVTKKGSNVAMQSTDNRIKM